MFGTIGMGISASLIAGALSNAESSQAYAIVAAIYIFLFRAFFGIKALSINYLYGTEVTPLAYRVLIYALTTTALWHFNFLVVQVTPVGFANIGYRYHIVFACTNLSLLTLNKFSEAHIRFDTYVQIVIYFFLPETQQRSLEDMDSVFREAKSALDVVRVSRKIVAAPVVSDFAPRKQGDKNQLWDTRNAEVKIVENA